MWIALGGFFGATGVAMAAAAAHVFRQLDARGLAAVQSAVQMQGWHAIALVLTGLWLLQAQGGAGRTLGSLAGGGFALGILLFCGAIYGNHLAGLHTGPLAPIGGVLLMLAWLCLAAAALTARL